MARTKAEVRAFLDSKVGSIVPHPGIPDLNGQCVTLIKALMDFLGVPNAYAARGNAKDVGDTLLRQGIAQNGKGWLTIVVNRSMGNIGGVTYGHIWADLQGEANYESNGNRALYTTKNTRPLSQGQQFINLDNYIKGDITVMDEDDAREIYRLGLHREPESMAVLRGNVGKKFADVARSFRASQEWLSQNHMTVYYNQQSAQLANANRALTEATEKLQAALANDETDKKTIAEAAAAAQTATEKLAKVTEQFDKAKEELDAVKAREDQANETGNAFLRWLGNLLNGLKK